MSHRSLRGDADESGETPTPAEILAANLEHGPNEDSATGADVDSSTPEARAVCEAFVDQHLVDEKVVTSQNIRAAVDAHPSVRIQAIGRALGCRMAGTTPDDFLDCVAISKWSDSHLVRWRLTRVSGACSGEGSITRPQQKADLVKAVEAATAIDAEAKLDDDDHHSVRIRRPWMRDAVAATIDAVDADVGAADDDGEELDVDKLTVAECSAVLGQVLDAEVSGHPMNWTTETIRGLYDLHVRGCDPSEVEL